MDGQEERTIGEFGQTPGDFGGYHDFPSEEEREQVREQVQAILDGWEAVINPNWRIPDKCFADVGQKSHFITVAQDARHALYRILKRLDD